MLYYRRLQLKQTIHYVFPISIQQELFPPHFTRWNQWKSEKNVWGLSVWNKLKVLFVILLACVPARLLLRRCLQHISSRYLLFWSDGQHVQGKLLGMCLPVYFSCKSSERHTSTRQPFLTHLSLDSISALTANLLCDYVQRKLHNATGIEETAYRKNGSSFKDQGQDQSGIITRNRIPAPPKRSRLSKAKGYKLSGLLTCSCELNSPY